MDVYALIVTRGIQVTFLFLPLFSLPCCPRMCRNRRRSSSCTQSWVSLCPACSPALSWSLAATLWAGRLPSCPLCWATCSSVSAASLSAASPWTCTSCWGPASWRGSSGARRRCLGAASPTWPTAAERRGAVMGQGRGRREGSLEVPCRARTQEAPWRRRSGRVPPATGPCPWPAWTWSGAWSLAWHPPAQGSSSTPSGSAGPSSSSFCCTSSTWPTCSWSFRSLWCRHPWHCHPPLPPPPTSPPPHCEVAAACPGGRCWASCRVCTWCLEQGAAGGTPRWDSHSQSLLCLRCARSPTPTLQHTHPEVCCRSFPSWFSLIGDESVYPSFLPLGPSVHLSFHSSLRCVRMGGCPSLFCTS